MKDSEIYQLFTEKQYEMLLATEHNMERAAKLRALNDAFRFGSPVKYGASGLFVWLRARGLAGYWICMEPPSGEPASPGGDYAHFEMLTPLTPLELLAVEGA